MKAQDIYSLLPRLLTFSSFVILLVAVANTYACKGLDRIEEKLPILNQPTNQVSLGPACWGLPPGIFKFYLFNTGCADCKQVILVCPLNLGYIFERVMITPLPPELLSGCLKKQRWAIHLWARTPVVWSLLNLWLHLCRRNGFLKSLIPMWYWTNAEVGNRAFSHLVPESTSSRMENWHLYLCFGLGLCA